MAGTAGAGIVPDYLKKQSTSTAIAKQKAKTSQAAVIAGREAAMAKNFTTAPAASVSTAKTDTTKAKTTTAKAKVTTAKAKTTSGSTSSTSTVDTSAPVDTTPAVDPITSAYAPLADYFSKQADLANERYTKNAANITSIFGTLSDVRQSDIPKIQQQYATSLQQQQDAVAQRMALQNSEAQQGRQGAATAASELGSGGMPAPTSSMSGGAYTASNTDANAYQTTWNALQQVMSAQQQENVRSEIQGYNYQKVATLENLQKSLEDRLSQLSGSNAQVLGDIANAKISSQQAQASMANDWAMNDAKLQNALQVAGIRAAGQQGAASTSANARLGAAQISAAARLQSGGTSTKSIADWESAINQVGGNGAANQVRGAINDLVNRIRNQRSTDPNNAGKSKTSIKVTPQDIMAAWTTNFPNFPATGLVQEYLNKYY
jgi:hypothetical protein